MSTNDRLRQLEKREQSAGGGAVLFIPHNYRDERTEDDIRREFDEFLRTGWPLKAGGTVVTVLPEHREAVAEWCAAHPMPGYNEKV